jgi:hypothetical protein
MFPSIVEVNEGIGSNEDSLGAVFIEPWVQCDGIYTESGRWESPTGGSFRHIYNRLVDRGILCPCQMSFATAGRYSGGGN